MYCRKCGAELPDTAIECYKCKNSVPAQDRGESDQVPDYMPFAVAVTLLCCLPLGIVSIVYASQANSKARVGDLAGASRDAASARLWCILAVVLGFLFAVLWVGVKIAGEQ